MKQLYCQHCGTPCGEPSRGLDIRTCKPCRMARKEAARSAKRRARRARETYIHKSRYELDDRRTAIQRALERSNRESIPLVAALKIEGVT